MYRSMWLALFLINSAIAATIDNNSKVEKNELYISSINPPDGWVRDEDEEDQCEHGEDE